MKLSVIVPCYNSEKYLDRLLRSIYKQKYDCEVVLADDHSTEPYDDVVDRWKDKLQIVRTQTEYNCCPGNTRQAGYDASSGEWVTFADHDDAFYPGAFQKVFSEAKKHDLEVIHTDFDEVDPKTEKPLRSHHNAAGWTHGKFFKRSFWERHHLRYKKDLLSHEDIYMSSLVSCCLALDDKQFLYIPVKTYMWTAHPESVSRSEQGLFIEHHFEEYLESSGYVFTEFYKNHPALSDFTKEKALAVILVAYFYHMGIIFRNARKGVNPDIAVYVTNYVQEVKSLYGMTNDDILEYSAGNEGKFYWSCMISAEIATGPYIPMMTLQQYLSLVGGEE